VWGTQKRFHRFNMGAEQSVEGAPAGAPIDGGEPHPSVSLSSVSQEETIGAGAVSSDPVAETHKKCVEIDKMGPAEVVKMLNEALLARPLNNAVVEVCCRRVRVLCRDAEQCNECDKQGASAAVVGAMKVLPVDTNVQLQGLAAIVNLCPVMSVFRWLIFWQHGQRLTNLLTCMRRFCHPCPCSVSSLTVRSIPWCPIVAL
jgi:hypothetical protein